MEDLDGVPESSGTSKDRAINVDDKEDVSEADSEPYVPKTTEKEPADNESNLLVLHNTLSEPSLRETEALRSDRIKRDGFAIVVPPVQRRWEYRVYPEFPNIVQILEEYDDAGIVEYLVQLEDGQEDVMSFENILQVENGSTILAHFNNQVSRGSESGDRTLNIYSKRGRRTRKVGQYQISNNFLSSDDELLSTQHMKQPTGRRTLKGRPSGPRHLRSYVSSSSMSSDSGSKSSRDDRKRLPTRTATRKGINYSDVRALESNSDESEDEMVMLGKRKRTSVGGLGQRKPKRLLRGPKPREASFEEGTRRSNRNVGKAYDMREVVEDDVPEMAPTSTVAKYVGAKESFKELPEDNEFRRRHCETCDSCYKFGDTDEQGALIYCQGCTISYHQKCLGPRNGREHLVTKVGKDDFVLQCRRCVAVPKQKDSLAPDQGLCFSCHEPGSATSPFRERRTTKEEQKDREGNEGEDPIADVLDNLINNASNVLFRCLICYRASHLHHLPPRDASAVSDGADEEELAAQRFEEYRSHWTCKDCADAPAEVDSLVAWRPLDVDRYEPGQPTDKIEEDAKEYLIKWKKESYFKVTWMPGGWVWGVTKPLMRKAFAKRDNGHNLPKMSTQEAVPEDYLRVDIVLAVQYTNVVNAPSEKVARARVKEVKTALVKFKGLGYEDVVWAEPPRTEETERWADFLRAYNEWVMGLYINPPNQKELKARIAKVRSQNFGSSLALKTQPEQLSGGELMTYQLDGLNWLYYQWYKQENAILADEMGLGKTIQVIGFLATLKQEHGCWPFLVVVPNSTCPNWRREFQQWTPSLRVVSYYGSAEAKKLSAKYELFSESDRKLCCHVVVTSYDAAQDDDFRKVFRGVHWAGLVVDEGQRLKNDKNILYGALNALKSPFKLLLTGTPLQNNARELFNLMQFLDPSVDAEAMAVEYENVNELTKTKINELHEMLSKIFLRRTKAQVLKFLPSMAQIILPVTMSIVQKPLYKSILAQNPDLIRSILGSGKKALRQSERSSLNNILMQLRKVLCHPFVYNRAVEQMSANPATAHRGLVDASPKLQLMELMLPKLKERGHRVLIFSQFLAMLDIVEDFLDGIGLFYERLDGSMSSLEKQKRIDKFNAPNSPLFAFLLSTRAGGVGINLASADTVIILDPDFNPHQDIQALSRAHRIGQRKKVLVFQLTTRATAEEKIMQIGKKKMLLDHVLIEQMGVDDDAGLDLESIIRHGTDALFKDDAVQEIHYDSQSVDRLLDRSQVEDTHTDNDKSAESQFSFARVWANDKGTLEEGMGETSDDNHEADPSVWENILKERERAAAEEALARAEDLGRGHRKRQVVDYSRQADRDLELSPARIKKSGVKRAQQSEDSDTDYQERSGESEVEVDSGAENVDSEPVTEELDARPPLRPDRNAANNSLKIPAAQKNRSFKRAEMPLLSQPGQQLPGANGATPVTNGTPNNSQTSVQCIVCGGYHQTGYCPRKLAGVEFCNLCGLPHFGVSRTCPHLNSVTQLRAMVEAIKQSPEPQELKDIAKKKIVGIIGDLNQRKRRKEQEMREKAMKEQVAPQVIQSHGPQVNGVADGTENRIA